MWPVRNSRLEWSLVFGVDFVSSFVIRKATVYRWEIYCHGRRPSKGSGMLDSRTLASYCIQGEVLYFVFNCFSQALVELDDADAVVGDVKISVVELLHQLVLASMEELVEHLAIQLRLKIVKHQLSSPGNCYLLCNFHK